MTTSPQFDTQFQPTGRLLINAFRGFEKQLLLELQHQGFEDITLSHLNVIRHLNPEGMKLIELAKDAALSKQAISKICSNLVERNYIEISWDKHDGRAKTVNFSKKGTALVKAAINIVQGIEEEYLKELGETGYTQLREALITLNQKQVDTY